LTQEQAEEWRAVVGTKPADWFTRDNQAMMVDYCRHIVLGRRIAEQIDRFDPAWMADDEGLKRFDKLGAMLERHTRTIASLATRMRLTQQSRYNAQSANTAASRSDGASGARRPWEFQAG
jgi:hypothetical protein